MSVIVAALLVVGDGPVSDTSVAAPFITMSSVLVDLSAVQHLSVAAVIAGTILSGVRGGVGSEGVGGEVERGLGEPVSLSLQLLMLVLLLLLDEGLDLAVPLTTSDNLKLKINYL